MSRVGPEVVACVDSSLLVGRVETEHLVHPTETGARVESEPERADNCEQADSFLSVSQSADCDDAQCNGEYCANLTVTATNILL